MPSLTVKCVGCGKKKTFEGRDIPKEQPFCEACGSIMIAEQAIAK